MARLHVTGETGIRRPDLVDVAGDLAGGDRESCALGEDDRAVLEAGRADLGALEVDEDADRTAHLVAGPTDVHVHLLVHGVFTVGEVQPGHIHTALDEAGDVFGGGSGGSDRADDLGAAHGQHPRAKALSVVTGITAWARVVCRVVASDDERPVSGLDGSRQR